MRISESLTSRMFSTAVILSISLCSCTNILGPSEDIKNMAFEQVRKITASCETRDMRISDTQGLQLTSADTANGIQERWQLIVKWANRTGNNPWEDNFRRYIIEKRTNGTLKCY